MFPIYDFVFDDDNTDKLARHGPTTDQVADLLDNPYVTRRNRKNRRAPYLLVGTDRGGRCITVPIQPTDQPMCGAP